jgi:hypothetical protein
MPLKLGRSSGAQRTSNLRAGSAVPVGFRLLNLIQSSIAGSRLTLPSAAQHTRRTPRASPFAAVALATSTGADSLVVAARSVSVGVADVRLGFKFFLRNLEFEFAFGWLLGGSWDAGLGLGIFPETIAFT